MSSGIRVTVEFTTPDICPIVELSQTAETTIDSVASNVRPSDCTERVTEFSMDTDPAPEMDITPIFSHGSTDRYRLTHGGDVGCPCECLGSFGCPVARYVAQDGTLTVVFHAADYDQLQEVIGKLRDRFPGLDIKRFIQSPAGEHTHDSVLVDRDKLTSRQLEILEAAYERGYFERPRRANATEIAADLDITPSTFREHLVTAETKILEDVL
ncbi:helix-turn-helix domain-containing protein [Halopenitus sp. H-Gu1]|uniref:helix-turn-helix domain-containing protein n=1 Tax=Halopenitus sp. H-Gu1 TaxID=3242697 RepID=UPI00359E926A